MNDIQLQDIPLLYGRWRICYSYRIHYFELLDQFYVQIIVPLLS